MELKITILSENSVVEPIGIIGEHGFSAFVETEDCTFLFDSGQGYSILNNSLALEKDLTEIEFMFLSHGHYDHAMGIPQILKIKSPLDIYAHPNVFKERYHVEEGESRFIGIPYRKSYLESLGAKFKFRKEFEKIAEEIYTSGEIPRKTSFEKIDPKLKTIDRDGKFVQDKLEDDISLAIETSKGLVVISGCAHSGIVNVLTHFLKKTDNDRIYAVIGGTHLGSASDKQVEKTLEFIEKHNIQKIGVSHCTGLANSAKLYNRLGDRFLFASAGETIEI